MRRGLGVVATDLAASIAALQDFQARIATELPDSATSTLSQVFSAADLTTYAYAWGLVRSAVLSGLDPIDQAAISGGINDAGNPATTLGAAYQGLATVLAAAGAAPARPFPWLLTAGILLTAVVGVVLIRRSSLAPGRR